MTTDNAPLVNRELSWLEFNRRVLEEAQDETVPLLERVKFLGIFSSNLDEYYMVRVAGLKRQIAAGDRTIGPDGLTPSETMLAVAARIHDLVEEQHRFFIETLVPRLEALGIRLIRPGQETPEQTRYLLDYFQRGLLPVVTPLAVDPGHPFPHLANRALCLAVSLRPIAESPLPRATLSLLHVPPTQVAPRFVALPAPADQSQFMLLEDVLRLHLPRLYEGYEILSSHGIRVTRDAEVEIRGDAPRT
jgi:polyphosphate kinase